MSPIIDHPHRHIRNRVADSHRFVFAESGLFIDEELAHQAALGGAETVDQCATILEVRPKMFDIQRCSAITLESNQPHSGKPV